MAQRLELQSLLEEITEHVYFQAPTNVKMEYPCIIYKRDDAVSEHGDNLVYRFTQRYSVTVIDRDPDSTLPQKVARLPMCRFDRFYVAAGLNHDVFNLFF